MIFFRIYQILIALPLLVVATVLACLVTIPMSIIGFGKFWGYWPAKIWAILFCWLNFVRVKVKGRNNIKHDEQYVFVANHQGAYDIFAVYGFMRHNFRWMMKKSLENVPLVGYTCRKSGHIYVDNTSAAGVRRTMAEAAEQLKGKMSVVVFPEGSRTKDGSMHEFKRGAFMLAAGIGLPIVPLTIDGAYRVMPRGAYLPRPGKIIITIHKPIMPVNGRHNTAEVMAASQQAILSALPEGLAKQG